MSKPDKSAVLNDWRQAVALFLRAWKAFFAVHLVSTLTSLVVLAPLFTLFSGTLILLSGDAALTDQDILFFVLSPAGFVAFVIVAALFCTFLVFGTALMFLTGLAVKRGYKPGLMATLRHVAERFVAVFRLAAKMVMRVAVVAAPFLALSAFLFLRYLTEYDINYYLAEHPPVFLKVAGIIAILLLVMAVALARRMAGWVVALPLLLLDQGSPASALKDSVQHARPLLRSLTLLLLSWMILSSLVFAMWGTLFDSMTTWAMTLAGSSLSTAAAIMAALLLLWLAGNFLLGFISGTVFVLGLVMVFDRAFPDTGHALMQSLYKGKQVSRHGPKSANPLWRPGVMISLLALILAVAFGLIQMLEIRIQDQPAPQIMAHRGASFEAPENTLAAISLAIEQGADWVEIDVQETADGNVVVIHDSDLMKLAGLPERVGSSNMADLQKVDVGSWKNPMFSAERIPTLAEVLALTRGRIGVNIELKYYGHEKNLEQGVIDVVERSGDGHQLVFMSLYYPGVQTLRKLRPDWTVGLLASVSMGQLNRLKADFFAVNASFVNRGFVRSTHHRNKQVFAWTVNDPVLMSAMASLGVDAVITDRPGLAREVYLQRSELEPLERVLLLLAGMIGSEPAPQ